jgi:hypothetical protein
VVGNSDDDFDGLKLPQNFDQLLKTKRIITNIPLRKPYKHEWVMTHSEWEQPATALKLSGDRKEDLYLLHVDLATTLPADLITGMSFVPTVTKQGTLIMWPLRLPRTDGRSDTWATSALNGAHVARTRWVQLHADMPASAYIYLTSEAQGAAEPAWPDLSWSAMRELAFRERFITSLDHPVLQDILYGR